MSNRVVAVGIIQHARESRFFGLLLEHERVILHILDMQIPSSCSSGVQCTPLSFDVELNNGR